MDSATSKDYAALAELFRNIKLWEDEKLDFCTTFIEMRELATADEQCAELDRDMALRVAAFLLWRVL